MNNKFGIINYNDMLCKLIISYPFLYNIAIMITDSGGRRLAQIFFCLLCIGILNNKIKKDIIIVFIIIIICIYNCLAYGYSYIIHMDFYGFIILILVFTFFSNRNILECLERKLINKRYINIILLLYFASILLSIVFCNGLRPSDEWGVSIPMLFGPFELPHGLAYELIIIYCIASIMFHNSNKIIYMIIMGLSAFCIAWTGVRSAFLALFLLIIFDYFSLKRTYTKVIILFLGIIALLYLAVFTDFIINNPIIQKTITALNGGSGISNGRGMMNNYLVDVYINKLSIFEKIFGIGMNSLRRYMYLLTATYLHAHNDVLNILIGHGLVSLILFTWLFFKFCNSFKNTKIGIVVFIILFVLILTNGLYMYVCFTPCIAIMLIYSKFLNVKV